MTAYAHLLKKRKRTRVTPELLGRMADMRKRGLTYKEIAKKLGVSFQTVASRMQREGLGGMRRKVTPEVIERMRELRRDGMSKRRIAGEMGLSYGTVLEHLGEEGILGRLRRRLGLG